MSASSEVTASQVQTWLGAEIDALRAAFNGHRDLMEKTVEATEKQLAVLSLGYAEQAVIIEALVGQLAFSSEEERATFRKSMNEHRQEMFKIMREGADVISSDDPGLASALEDAIAEREADTTD